MLDDGLDGGVDSSAVAHVHLVERDGEAGQLVQLGSGNVTKLLVGVEDDDVLGAGLRAGDKLQVAVRPSNAAFHPPNDPTVPMMMVCAGSGLAPMRGFLQECAEQKRAGREVAKSLLFFGCRVPGEDFLYADSDLKEWAALGVVDVRPAFSRKSDESLGCKYVQE